MDPELDFALIDDIFPISCTAAAAARAEILLARPRSLGPLIEYAYHARRCLPHLPSVTDLVDCPLTRELHRVIGIGGFNRMALSTSHQASTVEFHWVPPSAEEFLSPPWVMFRRRVQNAAERAGFARPIAAGLTGAFAEMADNAFCHSQSSARGAGFLDDLASLGPIMVTTPNFSLFSDKPREDNLYNMKRIAICWHELASHGIPTALHLNARTHCDWKRWQEFLSAHSEIRSVAFEFGTGAATKDRALWYLRQLTGLAESVRRSLRLILRGGRTLLPELRKRFDRVVFIAPDPLMKARKRRLLTLGSGSHRPLWRKVKYNKKEKIDQLFLRNLAEYSKLIG